MNICLGQGKGGEGRKRKERREAEASSEHCPRTRAGPSFFGSRLFCPFLRMELGGEDFLLTP